MGEHEQTSCGQLLSCRPTAGDVLLETVGRQAGDQLPAMGLVGIDADLLAWFRRRRGYQTRINAILRAYMNAHSGEG